VEAVNRLKVRSCLIDGEAVVCDDNGLAVFERLRKVRRSPQVARRPVVASTSRGIAGDEPDTNRVPARHQPIAVVWPVLTVTYRVSNKRIYGNRKLFDQNSVLAHGEFNQWRH
jgi:hypothetical protein